MYCTECLKPCNADYREEYCPTDRGEQVLISHTSDCCNAEIFDGPKDVKEYRRMLVSYINNMSDEDLFKWFDAVPVEEVLEYGLQSTVRSV